MAQTKLGAMKSAALRAGYSLEEYAAQIERGLKWCYKCRTWQARDTFNVDNSRGDGRTSQCPSCRHVKERKSTKGRVSTFKGHHHTDKAKQKLSTSHKGLQPRLGKHHTIETRMKISKNNRAKSPRGAANPNYKDGKAEERRGLRFTMAYKRWRFDVFARDSFTCQDCGDARGGNLNAHHIKPFADYPDLRFELSNGITLCQKCHDKIHDKPDSIRKRRKVKS